VARCAGTCRCDITVAELDLSAKDVPPKMQRATQMEMTT
jgi:hypothetical protein